MVDSFEHPANEAVGSTTSPLEIMHLVRNLCLGTEGDLQVFASERGWIDAYGRVTPEGHDVVEALKGQAQTRSVFRPFG